MTQITLSRRRGLWLSVAILLGVMAWLVVHWPRNSLWYDEALTTYVATDSWATLWNWCTHVDIQVPFHYVVLRTWIGLLGDSEFALRLLSALCIPLAVAGIITTGKRLTQQGLGYAAAILLAFAPGTLWIAYEVRAYALALALFSWATAFLVILIDSTQRKNPNNRWWLAGYVLLILAALYTHYTALGAFAAHLAILSIMALVRRSWPLLRTFLAVGILIGLGFAPWLPVLLARSTADRSYYTGQPIQPGRAVTVMIGFKLLSRDDIPDQAGPLVAGYAGVMILGILLNWRSWRAILTGALIIAGPVAITAALVYFKPKLAGRYAWPAWIGFDLLAGLTVVALVRFRRILGIVALISIVATPWLFGERGHPSDSDYRGAFAYLCSHGTPDDMILLRDGTLFVASHYYDHRPPCGSGHYTLGMPEALITDVSQALTLPDAQTAMRQIAQRHPPNVWVIAWQGDNMDPQGLAYGLLDGVSNHSLVRMMFGDVRLDRYEHPQFSDDGINDPAALASPSKIVPVAGGPTLEALRLFAPEVARTGDVILLQAWWLVGQTLQPDLRVSARITTLDGGWIYAQVDQPPAGWKYVDDRWQPDIPALGRYELPVGPDVPTGKVAIRYVLYDALQRWQPIILTVGEVTIQRNP